MANEIKHPTTRRAYTLRLRGINPQDHSWRDALWATHEAVNRGAKVFGEWLLTLRGGLDHQLADAPVKLKGSKTSPPTNDDRRDRRILLALSWLSVEDARGAPNDESLIVAKGTDSAVWRGGTMVRRRQTHRHLDRPTHLLMAHSLLSVARRATVRHHRPNG